MLFTVFIFGTPSICKFVKVIVTDKRNYGESILAINFIVTVILTDKLLMFRKVVTFGKKVSKQTFVSIYVLGSLLLLFKCNFRSAPVYVFFVTYHS